MEIFKASLRGMLVSEEVDSPILAPRLVVQTLPTHSLCLLMQTLSTLSPRRTTLKTVVTDIEN